MDKHKWYPPQPRQLNEGLSNKELIMGVGDPRWADVGPLVGAQEFEIQEVVSGQPVPQINQTSEYIPGEGIYL